MKHYLTSFSSFRLILIVVIAIILRFYHMSSNPPSLNWDETSIGYNAYSILKTGADEYENKWPLSFRSFDDYKPPVYIYLTVPSVAIFGLSEFAVRAPSATFGVLTVLAVYFLVLELLKITNTKTNSNFLTNLKNQQTISLLAAFFLAISPWHLQFSRTSYEGNMGVAFFVFGVLFFLKGLKNKWVLIISSLLFGISMYTYHSFRIVTPLFILILLALFYKELLKKKLVGFVFVAIVFLFFITFAQSFFQAGGAGSRLSMVTIFSDPLTLGDSQKQLITDRANHDLFAQVIHNRRVVYFDRIASAYLDHFNPDFLFFHGDKGVQHHAVNMGMLYFWDSPFLLLGIYVLLKKRNKLSLLLLLWLLIGPIPASITTGTPHPVRAIAMIPTLQIIAAVGLVYLYSLISKRGRTFVAASIGIISVLLLLNFSYYLYQYYIRTPIVYGYFWQYGNKEVITKVKTFESSKDKIIITYEYDQPYIYYLFYNKIDPAWYQKNWDSLGTGEFDRFERKIGKYEFRRIDYLKDKNLKNALLVGSPKEIPQEVEAIDTIYYLDGRVAYKIVATDK